MRKGFEKRFNNGDIVYWCHSEGNGKYSVRYGMVDEQFSDAVVIDYLATKERRRIDGVPIDEFKNETHYKKLPKGWSYDTKLYELTYDDLVGEEKEFVFDVKNPDCIKEAYEKGYLIKDSTKFHGNIEAEITKEGYRIAKKYPMYDFHIDHTSVRPDKVYFSYEEAEKEVNENVSEFMRQVDLSDYDWSVEQIDETLNRWKKFVDASDKEVEQYRDWLLSMDNVEDIETRISNGNIQWRYWKNKKWNYIEL